MNSIKSSSGKMRLFALVVLCLFALLHALQSLSLAMASGQRMTKRAKMLDELHSHLEGWHGMEYRRIQYLDILGTGNLFDCKKWLEQRGQGAPDSGIREHRLAIWDGRADLAAYELEWQSLQQTQVDDLLTFIDQEESPLRLATLRIDPLAEDGMVRTSIRLEAIQNRKRE